MSQNFFSNLAQVEYAISEETQEEREQYGELRLTALIEMKAVVYSCVWCDTKKTRQMMRYIDMKSVEVAKLSDISSSTVRSAKGIICGNENICKRTIVIAIALTEGYNRIENFVPDMVIRHIEDKGCCNKKKYKVSELREELDFLKAYNQIQMKSQLDALDSDKLAYIFSILKPSLLTGGDDSSVNMQKLRLLSKIM